MERFVNLDEMLKKLNAKTKLDHKESSDGLWEVNLGDLLDVLRSNSLPYPIFISPVGGYAYLYFVTETFKLPLCVRVENIESIRDAIHEIYQKLVINNATV